MEIKNLNSFRAMERAVAYEIKRQQDLLDKGEEVKQETRGWNDATGTTFPQRVKEGSADYRYFPDPDLPSLKLSSIPEFEAGTLKKGMPELPSERRKRYSDLGLKPDDTEAYVRDTRLGDFFEEVIKEYSAGAKEISLASNYIANDLVNIISSFASAKGGSASGGKATKDRRISRPSTGADVYPIGLRGSARDMQERDAGVQHEFPISVTYFQKIIEMISSNKISSRAAKDILSMSAKSNEDPEKIAKNQGLFQTGAISDIEAVIDTAIRDNPKVVGDYKAGKAASLQYLIGQCMKAMRGAADPVVLRNLLIKKLS